MVVRIPALVTGLAALGFGTAAQGTEGALGREISGTNVMENGGILPPQPIFALALGTAYQDGSISGSRQVPIVGRLSLGIHSDLSLSTLTGLKVWDTGPGVWNFSSSFTLPYVAEKIGANVLAANATVGSVSQTASNLFDIYFVPLTAGYHFSETEHASLSLGVWAPTGNYDEARLANPSLNNWTFVPNVSYTKLLPKYGAQFDANAGLQFYTRNSATDYQNAPLLNLDLMLLKAFPNGLAIGAVFGWIEQLGNDSGPTADRLHGFQGDDISIGPYLSYTTRLGGMAPLSITLRWVPTVYSNNRISGDTVTASISLVL